MFCVIQEVQLKKSNKQGHPKDIKSYYSQMSINGKDSSHYSYSYSEERFDRTVKKAYKISIHQSYREKGKIKKKQYSICTINYYNIADDIFCLYDYDKEIKRAASELGTSVDEIYLLIQNKLDPFIEAIKSEYQQTEEYITHAEHERIIATYKANKEQFNKKYCCYKYDQIYDVFGNLMNKELLDDVEAEYRCREEYEQKSRSYQEQYYSNYNEYYSEGKSSYSKAVRSNYNTEDKETLKQFYRVLSKRFHPDANPNEDTSKHMQLLNQLKAEWGV